MRRMHDNVKLVIVAFIAVLVFSGIGNTCIVSVPCPTVLETTFGVEIAEWVAGFTKPFLSFLDFEDQLKKKMNALPALLTGDASAFKNIGKEFKSNMQKAATNAVNTAISEATGKVTGAINKEINVAIKSVREQYNAQAYAVSNEVENSLKKIDKTLENSTGFDAAATAATQQVKKTIAESARMALDIACYDAIAAGQRGLNDAFRRR